MTSLEPSDRTLWPQVIGLGLLNAAMSLSWLAYQLYLPQLLTSVGISAAFAATLLLLESGLAILLEPLFGFASDRTFRSAGTRWPFIALGSLLSCALLAGIPLLVLPRATTAGAMSTLMPGLLIAWSMAMAVCRTPTLALLGRYSMPASLPRAAAVMTCLSAGVAALRPGAGSFILSLGPIVCFGIASAVMLGCTGLLRVVDANDHPAPETPAAPESASPWKLLALVIAGAAFGIANKLAFGEILPRVLGPVTGPERDRWMVAAFVVLALAAFLSGAAAKRLGNNLVMPLAAILAAIALPFLPSLTEKTVALVGLGGFVLIFSGVANGVFPFVFGRVPAGRGGLGLGLFFGGLAAGTLALGLLVPKTADLSATVVTEITLGALGVLAILIVATAGRSARN